MFGRYVTVDGLQLYDEDDDSQNFYLCVLGCLGAVDVSDNVIGDPNDIHLMFHSDYRFMNTETTFSFQEDKERLLLIGHHKSNKYYVCYNEKEGTTLFTEKIPNDPMFIWPTKKQQEDEYHSLFIIRNNKYCFKLLQGGAYLLFKRCHGEVITPTTFYFMSIGDY